MPYTTDGRFEIQGRLKDAIQDLERGGDFFYLWRFKEAGPDETDGKLLKERIGLVFLCPCGCGGYGSCLFVEGVVTKSEPTIYGVTGTDEKPTLDKDIHANPPCCKDAGWDGTLIDGLWSIREREAA